MTETISLVPFRMTRAAGHVLADPEIILSSAFHFVVLTLRAGLGAGERPTESATEHAERRRVAFALLAASLSDAGKATRFPPQGSPCSNL